MATLDERPIDEIVTRGLERLGAGPARAPGYRPLPPAGAAHCDRLVFLRQGRIIAAGTPDELRAAAGRADATLEEAFLFFIPHEEAAS